MKNVKIVGFDCDGVMFDTINSNTIYYNSILEHFDRSEMTDDQRSYVHMHTVDEALFHLFNDQTEYEDAQAYRRSLDYTVFLKHLKIEPFLKPLLTKIKPKFNTAIATNRTDTMQTLLADNKLEEYFDIVVTASNVEFPKPYPDQLLKIINHFNLKPENMIYVGDSSLDELAAKAAGVTLVAYQNSSLSADFHINSLKEMEKILDL